MKVNALNQPSESNIVPQAVKTVQSSSPQRLNLRVDRVSLCGFGQDAGPRFHIALREAIMQGIQQRRDLSFAQNLQLDRISVPPLAAGATVEDAARQVASGLLHALQTRALKSNAKGRGERAHG